jgi:hypothetical protein
MVDASMKRQDDGHTEGFWDGTGESDALSDVCLELLVCADAMLVRGSAEAGLEALEEAGELGGLISNDGNGEAVAMVRSYSAVRRLWRAGLLCHGRPSQTQRQQQREAEWNHVGEQNSGRLRGPRGKVEAGRRPLVVWRLCLSTTTGGPGLLI